MKDYSQPYETPYYAELKRTGIHLPCFLTHIRTDAARIEKPKDARMFRMLFLTPRTDGCSGTIDTRPNTNLIMLKFPYILAKRRSEEGKRIRRQYKNDKGVPYQACKAYQLDQSGVCGTITTFTTDNNIMELEEMKEYSRVMCVASRGRGENNAQHFEARADGCANTTTSVTKDNLLMETTNDKSYMEYHEHPTKEDLLEYFGQRIKVRKMTPREALRLMDVDDADIDKMMSATETVTLKDGTVKTKKAISKTALYKLAGNSIVVSCLYHIFRTMFIPGQPENEVLQPNLFN